ncbi:hypothetical protein PILCRDRAFT_825394 [Piloderma croceum F 1598]|uniref:Sugar phosphate phosphatase n=1 Tax=Piloderma croceum (strain F 1598) TaxID=765440 RepID=A0A0C3FC35_PILCF|nr:hypothetical protein PILCRDRAFT_825394 [Piloderma croceum F 1598]
MFDAPYLPYDPIDKAGYTTVLKRWPVILTGIIDRIHRINHELTLEAKNRDPATKAVLEEKITEGKGIISRIGGLKYRMGGDKKLEAIVQDNEADVEIYNPELTRLAASGKDSWYTAPWLYAEYRLLRSYISQTTHWNAYDPFFAQKQETLQGSGVAIYQIATTMDELESQKATLESDPAKLEDLSLLTHLTPKDIAHLQTVGKDAQEARKEFILRDDQNAVWTHLKSLKEGRLDFVLDNDLVFADFLVTYTHYVSKVVFHPKLFPWFVSDVTPSDFTDLFDSLLSPTFFPNTESDLFAPESQGHLATMVNRWKLYLASGTFALSVPENTQLGAKNVMADFWTEPWPYWDMKGRAGELFRWLSSSQLVIFKWPVSTSFDTAVGPLAGSFPLLSLRTNKADVAVGIEQAVADRLDRAGEAWRTSGRYALVSFLPKAE